MKMNCWICDSATKSSVIQIRGSRRARINFCARCGFKFFDHNYLPAIKANKFEEVRLKAAGLKIPDLRTDFQNGTKQSLGYVKEYITKKDKGSDILEIGCSWGYFLKLLKGMGINADGLEINPVRANFVRDKLSIPCYDSLDEIEKDGKFYDKIFLFYVIQYVPNPKNYFKRLLKLLKKNGCIYVVTPNVNDVLSAIWTIEEYRHFFYERMSIAYYSVMAIKKMMDILSKDDSFTYSLATRQGYSFFNHLNWFWTGLPRTTGIVGGDNYVDDITKKLVSSKAPLGMELAGLIGRFDRQYRRMIEKKYCGNQIILKIKKNRR